MASLLGASWKTTTIAFVVAIVQYFVTLGAELPQTREDWGHVLLSAAIFAWGAVQKDVNVTNSQHPAAATAVPDVLAATPNPVTPGVTPEVKP